MIKMQSRRTLLVAAIAFATRPALGAAPAACADPNTMDADQKTARTTLHYVEHSPDPDKICAGCDFFQGSKTGCGNCQIFSGPANAKGHCDSWSEKS